MLKKNTTTYMDPGAVMKTLVMGLYNKKNNLKIYRLRELSGKRLFWGSIIKNHQKIYRLREAVRKTLVLGLYNNKTHQKIYRLGELSRKLFFGTL
jgi:hypothetical protein